VKTKHRRLWPLLFLPLLGSLAGLYAGLERWRLPFYFNPRDLTSWAAFGFFAGSSAMTIIAAIVLAYRLSQRRFTIGAILITIAVIAVLLACARSLFASGVGSALGREPGLISPSGQALAPVRDHHSPIRRAAQSTTASAMGNSVYAPYTTFPSLKAG
jgi:hypothetical protein